MVSPHDDIEEPEEPITYEDLVVEEPEREVDLEDYEAPKSYTETEEDAPQLSDLKAVLRAISPRSKFERVNDLAQPAMVSRIFPDNLLDKNKLIVLSLLEEYEEEDSEVPVIDIISNVQDILSIGYEGRGIVERLEIAGVAHEEEMEKLAKDLGL
jgi:hypothetical protein